MVEKAFFEVPDSLVDTPQAEIFMILPEDPKALVYEGLRNQFLELAKSA